LIIVKPITLNSIGKYSILSGLKSKQLPKFSLKRIVNPSMKQDFLINVQYKISTGVLSVGIEYSMCDLICDVINYYV